MAKDLYGTLNISKDATQDEIKKAFKKLAIQCHPDKCQNESEKEAKEEQFKKINEAYSVLSDPEKRARYDQFGVTDDNQPGMGGGPGGGMSMDDILKQMFGGGFPGGGMGGGGSFVFMDGMHGGPMPGMPPGFEAFFGGPRHTQRRAQIELIEVKIDINDIYYGNTKKVEFELLELCEPCKGTGAQDPSHILKCMTCQGNGRVMQQVGPFTLQSSTCGSCGGQGTYVQHNKHCMKCKGKKTVYNKKLFELKLPKGIPNNYEVNMPGKGAYNMETQTANDIKFRFVYDIKEPYSVDKDKNVHYTLSITLEELLAGFVKEIGVYNEKMTIVSEHYFNPSKSLCVKGKGLYDMEAETQRDFFINFKIVYSDNDRFTKYTDVLRKVVKTTPDLSVMVSEESKDSIVVVTKHL